MSLLNVKQGVGLISYTYFIVELTSANFVLWY